MDFCLYWLLAALMLMPGDMVEHRRTHLTSSMMSVIFEIKYDDHHEWRQAMLVPNTIIRGQLMRYPASETAERHERILDEASRLFRAKGIAGASIAEVMKASGLTHGAFYAHFDSKEALACASLDHAMDQLTRDLGEMVAASDTPKAAFLDYYLSERHRDHPENGCAMPTLAIEVAREPGMRQTFTRRVTKMIASFSSNLPWRQSRSKEDQAICFMSAIVGAMVLARAVDDTELSNRILAATRNELSSH